MSDRVKKVKQAFEGEVYFFNHTFRYLLDTFVILADARIHVRGISAWFEVDTGIHQYEEVFTLNIIGTLVVKSG